MTEAVTKEHAMNVNIMNVEYSTKIPNNVNLSEDRQVLKALEGWHPGYMNWWSDMGPEGFQQSLVYLRTAYSVDPWASRSSGLAERGRCAWSGPVTFLSARAGRC
jgi:hypothetical protein